ncbi:MAG TPA: prephenate dehydrogenase [Planctomycetaceae bacterium]|nr:prephenate dehydrogenase [Planctomycetaceae bacterium]
MSTSSPPSPLTETSVIVGVGLIGGSLAAAIKQRGLARRVVGVGRSAERLEAARNAGLIDDLSTNLAEAARDAQLVIVCTPVDRIVADVRAAAAVMPAGSLITDAGSVKGVICDSLSDLSAGAVTFIGSHPLAGSEKQGFEHACATLFDQRVCVITPTATTPAEQLRRLHRFWQAVGMQIIELSPADHDVALARTSHLPHAVAAALALALSPEHRRFAASGFRDTTRIAAGDPDLWTAIFQQNTPALIDAISLLEQEIAAFKGILQRGNWASLKNRLQQAKTCHDALNSDSAACGNS